MDNYNVKSDSAYFQKLARRLQTIWLAFVNIRRNRKILNSDTIHFNSWTILMNYSRWFNFLIVWTSFCTSNERKHNYDYLPWKAHLFHYKHIRVGFLSIFNAHCCTLFRLLLSVSSVRVGSTHKSRFFAVWVDEGKRKTICGYDQLS